MESASSSLTHIPLSDADVRIALDETIRRISQCVLGQERLVRGLVISLLCKGHVLIEGVPGLAKTTAVSALARAMQTEFCRLQFTPDLLPSDIIGSEIYRPHEHRFEVQRGPIFSNIVLVDEINRAPAKVQSALLEAMQERQVSIAGRTALLPHPFMVLATQNPIDQQGTYPLPEAQMDRFLMKLVVKYPPLDAERQVLSRSLMPPNDAHADLPPVLSPEHLESAAQAMQSVQVSSILQEYVLQLIAATRDPYRFGSEVGDLIHFGVSPRGTIALAQTARAFAYLNHRDYATPDDVRAVVYDVLRHRIVLTYEALAEEMSCDEVLEKILERVPVP